MNVLPASSLEADGSKVSHHLGITLVCQARHELSTEEEVRLARKVLLYGVLDLHGSGLLTLNDLRVLDSLVQKDITLHGVSKIGGRGLVGLDHFLELWIVELHFILLYREHGPD